MAGGGAQAGIASWLAAVICSEGSGEVLAGTRIDVGRECRRRERAFAARTALRCRALRPTPVVDGETRSSNGAEYRRSDAGALSARLKYFSSILKGAVFLACGGGWGVSEQRAEVDCSMLV